MPIHFKDIDVIPEVTDLCSALIVPCNMCPAVTVAVREEKPFMKVCKHFLKSAPFERHVQLLQSQLKSKGVNAEVFKSYLPHHWFMCMWSSSRRNKLQKEAKLYDAVIVLGCGSATETVRKAVESYDCKVIEAMEVSGIMNAQLRVQWPCNVSFENCEIVPLFQESGTNG